MADLTFVSDLHLRPSPSGAAEHFASLVEHLCSRQASGVSQHLYVLGDFLSFWVERALLVRLFGPPLSLLARLAQSGCSVTVLEGNRDFGFGPLFARASRAQLAGARTSLKQGNIKAVLLHGDQLATSDWRYRLFRRLVRSLPARLLARFLPSPLLLAGVRLLEQVSRTDKALKSSEAMGLDHSAAARLLESEAAQFVIHGHTHAPGATRLDSGAGNGQLLALGPWSDTGGFLVSWPESGAPQLLAWPSMTPVPGPGL